MRIITLAPNAQELAFRDGTRLLVSFGQPVAAFALGAFVQSGRYFSKTSARHVRYWLGPASARIVDQQDLISIMESK